MTMTASAPPRPAPRSPAALRRGRVAAAALAACAAWPAGASDPGAVASYYRAVFLPTLPLDRMIPSGIDDSGRVVGFSLGTSVVPGRALTWAAAAGLETLAAPGRINAIAPTTGQMVGHVGEGFPLTPTSWSASGGGVPLPSLYPGANPFGIAGAVNDRGWVLAAGFATATPPSDALPRLQLLRPGTAPIDLGTVLDAANTMALGEGIAAATQRSIVAGQFSFDAVTWTEAAGTQTFRVLGGDTFVAGVNNSGLVVGTTALSPGDQRGFLHDSQGGGTLRSWFDFRPTDINNAGLVVGTGAGARASAWSGGAVIDLNTRAINLNGLYELSSFAHVNNRGQIVTAANPTAAGVAAGLRPTVALLSECTDTCGQIKPFPNPAGTTLTIGSDWFDPFNAVDFVNQGRLRFDTLVNNRVGGTLRNAGVIEVSAAGELLLEGGVLDNAPGARVELAGKLSLLGGTVVNRGVAQLQAGAAMFVGGGDGWLNDSGSHLVLDDGAIVVTSSLIVAQSRLQQSGGAFGVGVIGQFSVLSGDAVIDGGSFGNDGSVVIARDIVSAPGRAGTLSVGAGGSFENRSAGSFLADRGSAVTVRGEFVNRGQASLAGSGTRMVVQDGGSFSNPGRLSIGTGARLEFATGAATANLDAGRIDLAPGAHLELQPTTHLVTTGSSRIDSAGRIDVTSAQWQSAANVRLLNGSQTRLNAGGRIDVEAGHFEIGPGAAVLGDGLFNQHAGVVTVNGELSVGVSTFSGGVLQGSGIIGGTAVLGLGVMTVGPVMLLKPGNSPGTLRFSGPATMDGVDIEVEISDWRRADRLVFDSELQVSQARVLLRPGPGFEPDLNDRFDWLRASGGINGGDALVFEGTDLGAGWMISTTTTADGSRLTLGNAAATPFAFDTIAPGVRVQLTAGQLNDIAGGRLVVSEGEFVIGGALAVREGATLTSAGALHIAPSGRLSTRGSLGHVGSEPLLNEGLLRIYDDGSLGQGGPLRNRGLIESAGTWAAQNRIDNEAGGRIAQMGQMSNGFWLRNEGRFELEGELVNSGWIDNLEGGEFVVAAGGSVRTADLASGRYRDLLGRTTVDGRLQAELIEFQGSRVGGSGVIAGTIAGDALFELGDGSAAPLTIEGVLGGGHAFDLDITDGARFGTLSVLGDTALTGGLVTFWLTEGGYLPQAGDAFSWVTVSGDAASLSTLGFRVMVRAAGFDYAWVPPADLGLSFDGRTLSVAVVPEPGTYGLMLAGLGLVAWLRSRRRAQPEATR